MAFLRIIYASIIQQHKDYFCHKTIYITLCVWPILTFITTYYSYKPFSRTIIMEKLGLGSEQEIYLFLLLGFIGMMSFDTLIQSAWRSAYATRISGALELLYMSPANRLAVLIGNAISSLLGSVWMIAVFGLIMMGIFREAIMLHIPSVICCAILLLLISICWGVFLNSLFLYSRDSGFLFTVFQYPVEMFSGAKIPYRMLPLWARSIGGVMPLTYIIIIMRRVILNGALIRDMGFELSLSVGLGIILLLLAFIIVKRAEKNARIHGSATLF